MPLNEDTIKVELKNFLAREKGKIGALGANALTNSFVIQENLITLQLTNPVEVDAIETIKADLVTYLRGVFKRELLQINYEVNAQNAIERPYTPKEKFDSMVKKNPILGKLKDKLGLDTDF
ncbi:hypothetical protein JKA74_00375 [Marivirga sp. S37H4]|uniref:DNA polymerase III subunit gamma/tau n=1 Tax=Marivirga aurantiaca TaxID=2802615 RepID=A0A935C4T5_9BACT|nr:hypothetical protein [Marivirga aurantiaca]MBK6263471.1 hypothetical protein [Marivirga aurantiaca]